MDISTVLIYLKDLLATIMTLLMMMSPAFGSTAEVYTAERPDELITAIAAVSDVHVETNNPEAYEKLKGVLEGIDAGQDIKTAVFTGDNVMNGQILEDVFFYSAVRAVNPAENNIVLPGNHDYGNGAEGTDSVKLRQKYLVNNALYLGNYLTNDYFYRVIDGVYIVCLVTERPDTEDFTMTGEQLTWLEGVLKEADEADAPVIVFNHYPLRYLDNEGTEYAEVDKTELAALLVKYGVKIFVHGHIHDDLGTDNFYKSYGVDCINIGRITELVNYEAGDGIVIEVYEDEILVRGRNFIKGEWIEELRYTY